MTNEIRVFTRSISPTISHNGWVEIDFDDINSLFTVSESRYFSASIFPNLDHESISGISVSTVKSTGGILDYEEKCSDVEFLFELSDTELNEIKSAVESDSKKKKQIGK